MTCFFAFHTNFVKKNCFCKINNLEDNFAETSEEEISEELFSSLDLH